MAKKFPRADLVHPGENSQGFRSIGGDGYSNRDPTHPGSKGGDFPFPMSPGPSVNGDRWNQNPPPGVDDQGAPHDW